MENQFTLKRIIGLVIVFALMFAWIIFMVTQVGVKGPPPTFGADPWDPYVGLAVACVLFVVVVDVIVAIIAVRAGKRERAEANAAAEARAARIREVQPQASAVAANPVERALSKNAVKTATGGSASTRGGIR